MNILLLKQARNLHQGLLLQKNKLNAQLANTTYQAFIDKSRIENGLDQIRDIKLLIEREIHILGENLVMKREKVGRLEGKRERAIEELERLEGALESEARRLGENTLVSSKNQQTNKALATTLFNLQDSTTAAMENKESIIEKIQHLESKIHQRTIKGEQTKMHNLNLGSVVNELKIRGQGLQDAIVHKSMQTEKFREAIEKSVTNINTVNQYSNKMKVLNSTIMMENEATEKKIGDYKAIVLQTQNRLYRADDDFKQKVVQNRGILNNNQSISVSNHQLYEQNKNLSLQLASDSKVLKYLEEMNIGLKQLLDEKRILNNHARSILSAPGKSGIEKELRREDSKVKSMDSTGFNLN